MLPINHRKMPNSKVRASMSWGPSPEYADWWYVVSWKGLVWSALITALAGGAVAAFTMLQFWSDKIRDQRADDRTKAMEVQLAQANATAREAELKLEQLRQRIAPRTLTQEQQNELTAKLSQFKDVQGTIVALPSTPESEMFASVLLAPLHAAGWSIALLRGQRADMILHPKGVIVQYPMDLSASVAMKDGRLMAPPGPWDPLVDALNELGIAASAIPWPMQVPNNIAIVISER